MPLGATTKILQDNQNNFILFFVVDFYHHFAILVKEIANE